jgi:hypothetical protein
MVLVAGTVGAAMPASVGTFTRFSLTVIPPLLGGVVLSAWGARRGTIYEQHWGTSDGRERDGVRFTLISKHDHSVIREVRATLRTPHGALYTHEFMVPMSTGVRIDFAYPHTVRKLDGRFALAPVPGRYRCRWEARDAADGTWRTLIRSRVVVRP